jgi:hypothetical protein
VDLFSLDENHAVDVAGAATYRFGACCRACTHVTGMREQAPCHYRSSIVEWLIGLGAAPRFGPVVFAAAGVRRPIVLTLALTSLVSTR